MIHPLNKRNGTLELWRFLFSLYILLFHIEKNFFHQRIDGIRLNLSLCPHGAIGVEFFFLLTGIFLAQSARKEPAAPASADDLGRSTLRYLGKKCKGVFPCHLIAFAIIFIVTVWSERMKWLAAARLLIDSLPDVLLVQWSGIPSANLNGVEWYLSVMLISSAVIYPLCRRYASVFSKVAAPVAGCMIIGYLGQKYGRLTEVNLWDGLFYKSMLRGFAEILLGVFICEICMDYLTPLRGRLRRRTKVLLTLTEWGAYGYATLFSFVTFPWEGEFVTLMAIMLAVTLSYSGLTYTAALFNRPFVYFLGRCSLAIYLSQKSALILVHSLTERSAIASDRMTLMLATLAATAFFTAVTMIGGKLLGKLLFKDNRPASTRPVISA